MPAVGERKAEHPGVSSSKDVNHSRSSPMLMASFNLNYFLSPNAATPRVKASAYEFWAQEHSVHHRQHMEIKEVRGNAP